MSVMPTMLLPVHFLVIFMLLLAASRLLFVVCLPALMGSSIVLPCFAPVFLVFLCVPTFVSLFISQLYSSPISYVYFIFSLCSLFIFTVSFLHCLCNYVHTYVYIYIHIIHTYTFSPKLLSHLFSTRIPFYLQINFPIRFHITASWLFPSHVPNCLPFPPDSSH